jgi:hypothetical protein
VVLQQTWTNEQLRQVLLRLRKRLQEVYGGEAKE